MLSLQNAKSNLSKERRRKKFTTSRTKPKFPDDTFDHNSFKREMHGVFHNLRGVAIAVRKNKNISLGCPQRRVKIALSLRSLSLRLWGVCKTKRTLVYETKQKIHENVAEEVNLSLGFE